ncbi:MAG: hypothetical protein NT128_04275 [Proteobacteria bacterium]|nr:hypothetical protein [Pseudomonadota bacterium]
MNKISKIICVSLLALGASFLQAAEDVKRELSTRIVDLIDAYTTVQLNLQRQQPVAVSFPAVVEGTETKVLIECMETRDMRPYFDFVKKQKADKISTFVDGLLAENATFLDLGVNTGGGDWGPVDRTRDALKAALGDKVRGVVINVPAPAAANIKLLYTYHIAVEKEIAEGLEEYINLFAPSGDDSNFLAESVNQPEYRSRGTFKNAIAEVILR